jgi:hypothetical protein
VAFQNQNLRYPKRVFGWIGCTLIGIGTEDLAMKSLELWSWHPQELRKIRVRILSGCKVSEKRVAVLQTIDPKQNKCNFCINYY